MVQNAAIVRKQVLSSELKSKGKSGEKTYDQLADELGITKGVLWKFLNTKYIPTDPVIRSRLHLPAPIIQWRTRNEKGQLE